MMKAEKLRILVKAIEDAILCGIHKNEYLEVCLDCGFVLCMGCHSMSCQCSNDE